MRKFVISDIHGHSNFYYSVISYLENISQYEDVTLYINGDLIDRGLDSAEILLDVINRINNPDNHFKIEYLGGNHELYMYQVYEKRRKGLFVSDTNDWYINGGHITDNALTNIIPNREKLLSISSFIGNLKLYKKLPETINNQNIVIIHACLPYEIKDNCDLTISSDELSIYYLLETRKNDPFIPFRCRLGNRKNFGIVGHTPNNNPSGFIFDKEENTLNIDGGCAFYVSGMFQYNHFPLVEIKDNYLRILTFNSNNEIISGNYFQNNECIPFTNEELNQERSFLNNQLKPKQLVKLPNGVIKYND